MDNRNLVYEMEKLLVFQRNDKDNSSLAQNISLDIHYSEINAKKLEARLSEIDEKSFGYSWKQLTKERDERRRFGGIHFWAKN